MHKNMFLFIQDCTDNSQNAQKKILIHVSASLPEEWKMFCCHIYLISFSSFFQLMNENVNDLWGNHKRFSKQ